MNIFTKLIFFYKNIFIKLAKIYRHLTLLFIAKYLNKARKIHIMIDKEVSIQKDCKHPKNQYFWEFLYTEQKAVT